LPYNVIDPPSPGAQKREKKMKKGKGKTTNKTRGSRAFLLYGSANSHQGTPWLVKVQQQNFDP